MAVEVNMENPKPAEDISVQSLLVQKALDQLRRSHGSTQEPAALPVETGQMNSPVGEPHEQSEDPRRAVLRWEAFEEIAGGVDRTGATDAERAAAIEEQELVLQASGRRGRARFRLRRPTGGELKQAVGIGLRHWAENLNPKNFVTEDWRWRLGFIGGAAESLLFTALPLPGVKGFIKAGLNLAITQGGHIALNVARGRQELKARRIYVGDQDALLARMTEIQRKYGGANQKLTRYALGMSAGAMYFSLGSLVSEVGKEALGWDMDKMFQERFRPGEGAPATATATPTETPTGAPSPTATPTPAEGAGGAPAAVRLPEHTPAVATAQPEVSPTVTPTPEPSASPSPTASPTATPSVTPEPTPTTAPSASPAPVTLPDTHPATPTPSSTPVATSGAEGGTPSPAGTEVPPAAAAKPPVVSPVQPPTPAPPLAEVTPAAAPHIPETITLPKGSNPWTEVKGYLQQSLGKEPSGPEIQEAVSRVMTENNIADARNVLPGDLKIHGVNEYIQQLKGGQPLPAVTEQVTNIRAAEVGKVLSSVQDEAVKRALEQSNHTLVDIDQAAVDKAHQAIQHVLEDKANSVYNVSSGAEAGRNTFESWLATDTAHSQLSEVAQKAITEQAQAADALTQNVSTVLKAAPNLFTDQAIAHGTNVGQMLQDAGYQATWTGADAEMLGAHIAANNDMLTEMWHNMAAHQNIPESPFPVGLTELNDLVAKAQAGDKEALRRLLAALRYIPAGQKFRILNKEGISAVLAALG